MGAGIEGGRRKSKSETTLMHDCFIQARLYVVWEGEPDDFTVGVVSICSSPLIRQERGERGKMKEQGGKRKRVEGIPPRFPKH
jgi:hypothetical protein